MLNKLNLQVSKQLKTINSHMAECKQADPPSRVCLARCPPPSLPGLLLSGAAGEQLSIRGSSVSPSAWKHLFLFFRVLWSV